MIQSWFLLAIAAGLFSSLFNGINRKHLRSNNDSNAYSWWFEFFRAILFAGLSLFFFRFERIGVAIPLLFLLGISEFVAIYLFTKMHKVVELSTSSVLTQLRIILVPLLAFIFLNERLLPEDYVGMILLFFGILLTLTKASLSGSRAGLIYAICFSLASAVSSIVMKQVSPYVSVPIMMLAFSLPSVLIFPLGMRDAVKRLREFGRKYWKVSLLAVGANSTTLLLLGLAYSIGSVSRITAVFLSMFVCNVILGIFYLQEKITLRQVLGIVTVLIAVYLIH